MMSWELGKFSNCEWFRSNLLPVHTAGSVGIAQTALTVVSATPDAQGNVTSITFSGADINDPNAVLAHDKFQFSDGVAGQPNLRFRTFIGHKVSQSPVQFRAKAIAGSDGAGNVTVEIDPPLNAVAGRDQNLNEAIAAGMQVTVLPTHRCGLIMAGNPLYLGMPKLPEEVPFPTSVAQDPNTGCSIRQYYGSQFGLNRRGMVHDALYGYTLVPEYSMMVALPV